VFAGLWLILYLDSSTLSAHFQHSQWFANLLSILIYLWVYRQVTTPVRRMMLYGLPFALIGELFFSIVLGMYTYRLESVPLYVPFGHCVVYAAAYYLVKEPIFQQQKNVMVGVLYPLMILYSSAWLFLADDRFGFLCLLLILWILYRRPVAAPFFLVMYFVVVFVELLGTWYQCWHWPPIWFGLFEQVTSANPPSAISVVYYGFDAYCLWSYRQYHRQQWNRMRAIQRIKALKKPL